jgi:hypothetical protein
MENIYKQFYSYGNNNGESYQTFFSPIDPDYIKPVIELSKPNNASTVINN